MDSWYNLPSNNINVIYNTTPQTKAYPTAPASQPVTVTPAPDPATQGAITGIKPEDVAKATYGKIIPLVGEGSSDGIICTSPDGVTWTQRTVSASGVLFNDVSYNGVWVAVGGDFIAPSTIIVSSPDAITWTPQTPAASGSVLWTVIGR